MIHAELWYRCGASPTWYGQVMSNPKTRALLQRMRDPKWGGLFKQAERLLGELGGAAMKGSVDRGTFESILDALESYLDVMERRRELASLRGQQSTATWMQQAVGKLTGWLGSYA